MIDRARRGLLLRWLAWFAAANALVLCLASLRYLGSANPAALAPLTGIYLAGAYLSHLALLAALPLFLVLTPVIVLWPRRLPVLGLGVILMALLIAGLTLDSLVWNQSRFHLNLLTVRILGTSSWIFTSVMFLIALLFESLLARSVWRWVSTARSRQGWLAGTGFALCFLVSQGIHAWADASYHTPVTAAIVNLPAYRGITAKGLLERAGLVDVRYARERRIAQRMSRDVVAAGGDLRYPLAPLACQPTKRQNLLIIVVDSLRADAVSETVTPNMHAFAEQDAIWFRRHFSGGNSSRIGFFSLLYGLPPGYFNSIESLQRPTVLMSALQAQDYRVGIFSSSSLVRPAALDRTAFATVRGLEDAVPDIDIPHTERVVISTQDWLEWVRQQPLDRPFFGFIYLDSSRKAAAPAAVPENAGPIQRELAEYRSAMRANDALVGSVLDDLRERRLMDQTVVLITSDHGEQFGEGGDGLIGHGSAYSLEQLQVPLLLHWPGMTARQVETRTSHYDVVPTLMKRLLGCSNPPSDYSSGADLLTRDDWDWLLAGSYYNYAVIEPDQVTITFPNGTFEVRDAEYRVLRKPRFRAEVMEEVIEENSRFHP